MRQLQDKAELLLVIGSTNSSNSNRLRDLGFELGMEAHLIDDVRGLNPDWLRNKHNIAITAGASAPEKLVQELITALQNIHPDEVVPLTYKQENVVFKLPKMLAG